MSLAVATALTASGIHAKNIADNRLLTMTGAHSPGLDEYGLCRQMPGIIVGLFAGWALDNGTLVVLLTIGVNTCVYYWLFRLLIWIKRRYVINNPI